MKKMLRVLVIALMSFWLLGTVACGGENPISSDQNENSETLQKEDGGLNGTGGHDNGGGCDNGGGSIIAG